MSLNSPGHAVFSSTAGAVEAVKAAAASHPLVAKILMHGLVNAGTMKVAKMMHVFDGK